MITHDNLGEAILLQREFILLRQDMKWKLSEGEAKIIIADFEDKVVIDCLDEWLVIFLKFEYTYNRMKEMHNE